MGEARSSRPWDKAGASLPKNFFRPFGSQFGIQIRPWDKGRGHCPKTLFSGPPGPLSWILHCLSILLSLSPSSSPPPYALLLILPPLNSSTSYSRSFFHFYFPMSFPTLSFPLSLSRPLTSSLSHSSSPDSAPSSFKSFPLHFLAFLSPLCVPTLLSLIFSSSFSTLLFPLFLFFLSFLFLLHLLLLRLPQSIPIDLLLLSIIIFSSLFCHSCY